MTMARSMPRASSRDVLTTVMNMVIPKALHQIGLLSTVM
jgi:hypothetical protein